jgi:osmoprotectant transport system permease protein
LALLWLFISPAHGLPSPTYASTHEIKIGSKKFTESVILAEIVAQLAHSAGAQPVHVKELGGTRVLWNSLVKGAIDIYPEYTGTLTQEIFAGQGIDGNQGLRKALATYGIRLTSSLGFNNNYALGMKKEMC